MNAQPWSFGAPVAGYRWAPAGEPRATLLLAHGFGEYAGRYVDHYHGLVPALVARGIAMHAFDLEGHGGSPGGRGVVDVRRAVEQHLAARRALAGTGPLFLLGHSLGGLIAAASVARDGAGVAGVVLSAPLLIAKASPVLKLVGRVLARVAPGAGILPPLDPEGISHLSEEAAAYGSDPLIYRGKLPALTGASALAVVEDSWPRFPAWTSPVLALHGAADTFTDPDGSRRLIDTVAATDKTLAMFEGGRHELLNDTERERALAMILDWVGARTGGGGAAPSV